MRIHRKTVFGIAVAAVIVCVILVICMLPRNNIGRYNATDIIVIGSGSNVTGVSLNILSASFEGSEPYLEIECENDIHANAVSFNSFGLTYFEDDEWWDCHKIKPGELWLDCEIPPSEAATQKYPLKEFDLDADGIYRFESFGEVETGNGERITCEAWIEFELRECDSKNGGEVSVVDKRANATEN